MKLHNATSRLTVFILLGTAWAFVSPDVTSAQTNRGSFVVRDPVSGWYKQGPDVGPTNYRADSDPALLVRTFQVAGAFPVQQQEPTPQEKLDRDVDSIQLKDKSQDQLQQEIQDAVKLDEEDLARERQTTMDFSRWPEKSIGEIRVSLKDENDVVPEDFSYLLTERMEQSWSSASYGTKVFAWAAPNIRYQPLYFQNVPIERYGRDFGGAKQIAASGLHFFTSAVTLPYTMLVDHPRSCDYPLGYCRPGNTVPYTFQKALPRWRNK